MQEKLLRRTWFHIARKWQRSLAESSAWSELGAEYARKSVGFLRILRRDADIIEARIARLEKIEIRKWRFAA